MTIGRIPSVEGGIQPTIVDAKGDLIAATAADTVNRLAVGSNDQVLVADSAASTGLAWKSYGAQFVAGKNKIINGDFSIWQRGTTFTVTGTESVVYKADRWAVQANGSTTTRTISQQSFTAGTAPVAGYEGQFFLRYAQTTAGNNTYNFLTTRIEDVRTFAGQTVTLSFWAKADSARTVGCYLSQNFGSGGSATVNTSTQNNSLTTSWQRFTYTVTLGAMTGKTIGSASFLEPTFELPAGNITPTIDIWGVQLEAGSVATPFTTATGTIQGELAACQRYYYRHIVGQGEPLGAAWYFNSTTAVTLVQFPVTMRTTASLVASSGTDFYSFERNGGYDAFNSFILGTVNNKMANIYNASEVSGTAGQAGYMFSNNASSSLAFSAEL